MVPGNPGEAKSMNAWEEKNDDHSKTGHVAEDRAIIFFVRPRKANGADTTVAVSLAADPSTCWTMASVWAAANQCASPVLA